MDFSGKSLRKLVIPLVIEQTLAIAMGMADTIMVSSCGEAAVSGISLIDQISVLLVGPCAPFLSSAFSCGRFYIITSDGLRTFIQSWDTQCPLQENRTGCIF